jgi:hypothetical protein
MPRFAHIERRCLAVVGMLALALAYLPGVACLLNVAPACCAAAMCPMHNAPGSHMTCGMDTAHSGNAFQSCGCHSAQYTGGFVFDRAAPAVAGSERFSGVAPTLRQIAFLNVKLEVVLPPPRLVLS